MTEETLKVQSSSNSQTLRCQFISSPKQTISGSWIPHSPYLQFLHQDIMSEAQDIIPRTNKVSRSVSNSFSQGSFSTSPTLAFHSPPSGSIGAPLTRAKTLTPFATEDIKVLLLENINKTGQDLLKEQGYQVECLKGSLGEDELIEKIRFVL
jgi:hypothetical protein